MRFVTVVCFLYLAGSARAGVADERWPRRVAVFPARLPATLSRDGFRITISTPDDPQIRAGGGSGGPMLAFKVRDHRTGRDVTFYDQSICTVLLRSWHGHPQLEIWGRGGGGSWTRSLHRFIGGEYRAVRYDEFEDSPRHNNDHAPTLHPPFAFSSDGPDAVLHFVETRLP